MNRETALKSIGLSEGETKVYLALIKLGESKVHTIKQETKMHRTTIYDFMDSLIKKGLASYVVKNGVKFFYAAPPEKLSSLITEKQETLAQVMPDLLKIAEAGKRKVKVEVYEGVEGFKTFLNFVLREKKDLMALGIDERIFEKRFPTIMKSFFEKEQMLGIKERMISEKGIRFVYKERNIQYRYIDKEYFNPTATAIFGNNVAMIIWDPLTIVMVTSKELADAYRKYFKLLWRIAKK